MLTRVVCDGVERTVRDLTLGEACAIRERLGVSYLDLDMQGDPQHRSAVLEAFLTRTKGEAEARKVVASMTAGESEALVIVRTVKGERITLAAAVDRAYEAETKVTLEDDDGHDDTLPEEWTGPLPLGGSEPQMTDSSSAPS